MALIALLIGSFSRGWKISWSYGLVLASVLVPLVEVWQRVLDQGQQLRAQSHRGYLAVPVISEFPKSPGGRVSEYRTCTESIIHVFLFVFDAILNTCKWICKWHAGS